MHGLNVGPDGRIYWTIGDKGLNVTSKEGINYPYPNEGCMMRGEPDGSNFEVYVRGLRNLQEPRFDAYGNWFGVDNDGDSPGEVIYGDGRLFMSSLYVREPSKVTKEPEYLAIAFGTK